jgi:hypothetical protein
MERAEHLKDVLDEHMYHSSTVIMVKHIGQECRTFTDVADSVPTSHFPLLLKNIKRDLDRIRAKRKTRFNKGGRRGKVV